MKNIDLVRFAEVAAAECVRQQVDLDRVAYLLLAAHHLHNLDTFSYLTSGKVEELASMIEPSNHGLLRMVPAHFADMQSAVAPHNIASALYRLMNLQPQLITDKEYVDKWLKDFLEIHPFSDGNGRLAWLLRVWLLDQWDNPQPLPDYFGEK